MSLLCCCRYQTCDEFAVDARLVFDNCETFNEDDSAVGRAGHTMRRYFEDLWQNTYADCDGELIMDTHENEHEINTSMESNMEGMESS